MQLRHLFIQNFLNCMLGNEYLKRKHFLIYSVPGFQWDGVCEGKMWPLTHSKEIPWGWNSWLSTAPLDFLSISEQWMSFFTLQKENTGQNTKRGNWLAVLSFLIFPVIPLKDRSMPLVHVTRTEWRRQWPISATAPGSVVLVTATALWLGSLFFTCINPLQCLI